MRYLVIGGSASGKSEYAENLAVSLGAPRYYIATMMPFGEETNKRIEKHREARRKKQFTTIECFRGLSQCALPTGGGVYLLECMSNLVANEMFAQGASPQNVVATVLKGVEAVSQVADNMVIVTNDVFADGETYSSEMMTYLQELGKINCALASQFDVVVEVVCGIPIFIKGNDKII